MEFKLDHINLTVSNLDESVEWYKKIFAMELMESGVDTSSNIRWGIVGLNDSMICMTEYKNRKSAANWVQDEFHQINHFGFRVPDMAVWESKVKDYNLELFYGGVNEYPYSRSWYIKDPDGHTIEVSYTSEETLRF